MSECQPIYRSDDRRGRVTQHRERIVIAEKVEYRAGIARPFLRWIDGAIAEDGHPNTYFCGAAGFCVLAGGVRPEYTAFRIGLIVRRYAKMAFRSSSVMF